MGRKPRLTGELKKEAIRLLGEGESVAIVAKSLGVSTTAVRRVKGLEKQSIKERDKTTRCEGGCGGVVDHPGYCLACALSLGLPI